MNFMDRSALVVRWQINYLMLVNVKFALYLVMLQEDIAEKIYPALHAVMQEVANRQF